MVTNKSLKPISMKLISRLFFVIVWMAVFQTGSIFAQTGAAASLAAKGVLALIGGSRQEKKEKMIEQSTTREKISGSNVTVLRVKEPDIKSKAKVHIIALQKRLNEYEIQYKNNQLFTIPKNDSDLIAIQNMDENWPVELYTNELRAYKRYAFQQKQKLPAAPVDSLHTTPANPLKKYTNSAKS